MLVLSACAFSGCEGPRTHSRHTETSAEESVHGQQAANTAGSKENSLVDDPPAAQGGSSSDSGHEAGTTSPASGSTPSPDGTSASMAPNAGGGCPDVPCPRGECCVDGASCGSPMLVNDFGAICMPKGELTAQLDENCPAHTCQDPRAKCVFAGCRTAAGECGVWVDNYHYDAGGWSDLFKANLGCIVLDASAP